MIEYHLHLHTTMRTRKATPATSLRLGCEVAPPSCIVAALIIRLPHFETSNHAAHSLGATQVLFCVDLRVSVPASPYMGDLDLLYGDALVSDDGLKSREELATALSNGEIEAAKLTRAILKADKQVDGAVCNSGSHCCPLGASSHERK